MSIGNKTKQFKKKFLKLHPELKKDLRAGLPSALIAYNHYKNKKEMPENQEDSILPKGVRFFNKHDNAPDFVMGDMIISLNEFFAFCKGNPDMLRVYQNGEVHDKQIKIRLLWSKQGKLYGKVDTYGTPAAGQAAPAAPAVPAAAPPKPPTAPPVQPIPVAQTTKMGNQILDDLPF